MLYTNCRPSYIVLLFLDVFSIWSARNVYSPRNPPPARALLYSNGFDAPKWPGRWPAGGSSIQPITGGIKLCVCFPIFFFLTSKSGGHSLSPSSSFHGDLNIIFFGSV
jgi:hypothetical protein